MTNPDKFDNAKEELKEYCRARDGEWEEEKKLTGSPEDSFAEFVYKIASCKVQGDKISVQSDVVESLDEDLLDDKEIGVESVFLKSGRGIRFDNLRIPIDSVVESGDRLKVYKEGMQKAMFL